MERLKEISESELENVVSHIFENIDESAESVSSNSVLELVAVFVNSKGVDFELLEQLVNRMSIDGKIDKCSMKSVFMDWTKSVKVPNKSCILENSLIKYPLEISNQHQNESKSDLSISSQVYQEQYVEELEKKLAYKENLIISLKSEIQALSQHILLHEDIYHAVVSEKNQLIKKNQENQNNSVSYHEYNELLDSFHLLKESKEILFNKFELLKSENLSLCKNISLLDEEKQQLSNLLCLTEKEKKNILESLCKAELYIEELKAECIQLSDKILELEGTVKDLITAKECLESEISIMLNNSNGRKYSLQKYRDSLNESKNSENPNEESLNRELNSTNIVTSTPRNNVSLLDEFKELHLTETIIDFPTYLVNNNKNYEQYSQDQTDGHVENIALLSKINNKTLNINDIIFSNKTTSENLHISVSFLENELISQKEVNDTISKSFSNEIEEISSLRNEIDNLNQIITNMKECVSISDIYYHSVQNEMKDINIKTKALLYLMKENCLWIKEKHNNMIETLNEKNRFNSIPTDYNSYVDYIRPDDYKNSENHVNDLHKTIKKKSKKFICMKYFFVYISIVIVSWLLLAYIISYNIMKFCNKGIKSYYLPWTWISSNEFFYSIFQFEYEGPVPT